MLKQKVIKKYHNLGYITNYKLFKLAELHLKEINGSQILIAQNMAKQSILKRNW